MQCSGDKWSHSRVNGEGTEQVWTGSTVQCSGRVNHGAEQVGRDLTTVQCSGGATHGLIVKAQNR